jgi:nicotinamidase-related amidase
MRINTCTLIQGIELEISTYQRKLAVLIVDEHNNPNKTEATDNQIILLKAATALKIPIFAVDINPNLVQDPHNVVISIRSDFLPYTHKVLNKPHLNVFDPNTQPNLHHILQTNATDSIILMGYHVTCCVAQAAVGGYTGNNNTGTFINGAVQLGYRVLTCRQILRPSADVDNATWIDTNGVKFYEQL